MAAMKPEYMIFYLHGREADILDDDDVDAAQIADEVMAGADLRQACVEIGVTIAGPLGITEKREWIKDNREDITEAGGDAEEAFRSYQQGRIDAYAHTLETDVVEEMLGGDDEDEDEEGDDDEDDDIDDEDDVEEGK